MVRTSVTSVLNSTTRSSSAVAIPPAGTCEIEANHPWPPDLVASRIDLLPVPLMAKELCAYFQALYPAPAEGEATVALQRGLREFVFSISPESPPYISCPRPDTSPCSESHSRT